MSRNDLIPLLAATALIGGAFGVVSGQWTAVALGCGLGFATGLYGLAKIREALARVPSLSPTAGQNAILGAIVGTFLGRGIVLGAGLALGLKVLALEPTWIVISFFSLYVIAQALEIRLALRTRDVQPAAEA